MGLSTAFGKSKDLRDKKSKIVIRSKPDGNNSDISYYDSRDPSRSLRKNRKTDHQVSRENSFNIKVNSSMHRSELNYLKKKKKRREYSMDESMARNYKRNLAAGQGRTYYKSVSKPSIEKVEISQINRMMLFYKNKEFKNALSAGEAILKTDASNRDALYIIGLTGSMLELIDKSILSFEKLLELDPKYKKSVYLFLSISYKKKGDFQKGLKVLDKAIKYFPNFYEAYIYRAKMFLKLKQTKKAKNEFYKATKLDPKKLTAYAGLGDCNRIESDYKSAIENYSKLLEKEETYFEVLGLKRAICFIETKQYSKAQQDIAKVLKLNEKNCEALYFKGLLQKVKGENHQAILQYEQAIKLNTSETATLKAIHDIALIRIEEKDIYSAYSTIDRLDEIPNSALYLQNLKIFLEGAVSMIKKKFDEGIGYLDKIISLSDIHDSVKPLIISYKAYGEFSLGKIEGALNGYEALEQMQSCSKSDSYNKDLCLGILNVRNKKFSVGEKYFLEAQSKDPSKIEPEFYLWITTVLKFLSQEEELYEQLLTELSNDALEEFNKKLILVIYQAVENLEKIQARNDSCSNLSFCIGLLKLPIGLEKEAVENFNIAIDKSDENCSHHFLWKGIALCHCEDYNQALNDFRCALSFEPNNFECGIYKGRCYLFKNDLDRAYQTLKDFMEEKQQECVVRYWIGNFFFNNGHLSHAERSFRESLEAQLTKEALWELIRCYVIEKNLMNSLERLEEYINHYGGREAKFDYDLLVALKETSNGDFSFARKKLDEMRTQSRAGKLFLKHDMIFYSGFVHFYLGNFEEALQEFEKAKIQKYEVLMKENREVDFMEEQALENILEYEESGTENVFASQTFIKEEIVYNKALCYVAMGNIQQAKKLFRDCTRLGGETENRTRIILDQLEKKNSSQYEINENDSQDNSSTSQNFEFQIFPIQNRLSGIYPPMEATLPSGEKANLHLSFCLPQVRPPDMSIKVGFEILKQISINSVENKPEAPWIQRSGETIIFTNKVKIYFIKGY